MYYEASITGRKATAVITCIFPPAFAYSPHPHASGCGLSGAIRFKMNVSAGKASPQNVISAV